jgi:hypothetical protein
MSYNKFPARYFSYSAGILIVLAAIVAALSLYR